MIRSGPTPADHGEGIATRAPARCRACSFPCVTAPPGKPGGSSREDTGNRALRISRRYFIPQATRPKPEPVSTAIAGAPSRRRSGARDGTTPMLAPRQAIRLTQLSHQGADYRDHR